MEPKVQLTESSQVMLPNIEYISDSLKDDTV